MTAQNVRQDYFKEGITWTALTSGTNSFRYSDKGFIFDSNKGPMLLGEKELLLFLLGLLDSKVSAYYLSILNPTLSLQNSDLEKLPVLFTDNITVNILVDDNISMCKADWDSFETSWDFKVHPLVWWSIGLWDVTATGASMYKYYGCHPEVSYPVELCYMLWQGQCNERYQQLKSNEEESTIVS